MGYCMNTLCNLCTNKYLVKNRFSLLLKASIFVVHYSKTRLNKTHLTKLL